MPLPQFFSGNVAPFLAPMVGHRQVSSGGNYCYLPIPFRDGCRVSLIGAQDKRIWFQISSHRLADSLATVSFTGTEDLASWRSLLANPGKDPWQGEGVTVARGRVKLAAAESVVIAEVEGPDTINRLLLKVKPAHRQQISLRLTFDKTSQTLLPLTDLFAVGRSGETPAQSLLVGTNRAGELYSYFPMPFFHSMKVELVAEDSPIPGQLRVVYQVRRLGRPPPADSGYFGARRMTVERTTPGTYTPLLLLGGRAKWVGLFAELGSVDGGSREYLEGDERIFIDGATEPTLHGTGVEDFFGGGFYFRVHDETPLPFRLALNGMTYDLHSSSGDTSVAMYRLMLTDAPVCTTNLRADLEAGPTNNLPMRLRAVSYYYYRPDQGQHG